MNSILDKSSASLSIEGDAKTIIKSLNGMPRKGLKINATISIVVSKEGNLRGWDNYFIPEVVQGNSDNAIRAVEGLLHQGRIKTDQANELVTWIDQIAILTR